MARTPADKNLLSPTTARGTLSQAVKSMTTVGVCFIAEGALATVPLFAGLRGVMRLSVQVFAVMATVVLITPGVWYVLAARYINCLQGWAIGVSFKVALGQIAVVILSFFVALILPIPFDARLLAGPAILALFFLPALLALLRELFRARRAITVLESTGRAFEVENVRPVIPIEEGPR